MKSELSESDEDCESVNLGLVDEKVHVRGVRFGCNCHTFWRCLHMVVDVMFSRWYYMFAHTYTIALTMITIMYHLAYTADDLNYANRVAIGCLTILIFIMIPMDYTGCISQGTKLIILNLYVIVITIVYVIFIITCSSESAGSRCHMQDIAMKKLGWGGG